MEKLTAEVNVVGMQGFQARVVGALRSELAAAVRAEASSEKDGRVVGRLMAVAERLDGKLAAAQATEAIRTAPDAGHLKPRDVTQPAEAPKA